MDDPISSTSTNQKSAEDRLNSWKEIAGYLQRDVTTVQRWEKREGMPVHRHLHDRMGTVYAFKAELDSWARSRSQKASPAGNDAEGYSDSPDASGTESISKDSDARAWLKLAMSALVVLAILAVAAFLWLQHREYFWKNPVAGAQFQTVAEFEGKELSAAMSHDGHFVAFLSDRDGHTDVWITQIGSGQFHNLTHGSVAELVNPSVRTLGFSQDDALVTFWMRTPPSANGNDINIWAVPTLGGQPRPYLEGVAEFDWSHDGSRLAYHTPGPGDPLFVSEGLRKLSGTAIFTAPAGLHSHFPLWAPDSSFLYFVQGTLPDRLDLWRIAPSGGTAERITTQNRQVSYPVFLDRRTLAYLASDSDEAGLQLFGMDVERRIPHRLTSGLDRYTSLSASADGHRLVLTVAKPKRSLWRLQISDFRKQAPVPVRVSLSTSNGFAPRVSSAYQLYVTSSGTSESIWKLSNGNGTELWTGEDVRVLGAPAISPDGRSIAFSVQQHDRTVLYVMQADGTNGKVLTDSMKLRGSPAWEPDGKSITTAAEVHGVPHLFRVPLAQGAPTELVHEFSTDPVWTPDGKFVVYSGPDIGTTFSVKSATMAGKAFAIPALTLTRGARHLAFLSGKPALVFLRGEIQHKDLWLVDLETGPSVN